MEYIFNIFFYSLIRPSSASFQAAVQEGANILGAEVIDFGVVSTPVLHFVITCYNDGGM